MSASVAACCASGSSPLTRGKHNAMPPARSGQGLIPTHAGKTRSGWRAVVRPGAHPHSRGENTRLMPCQIVSQGSSPLTRGKPAGRVTSSCTLGLIPTHAGKTTPRRATRITRRAHPHSRGENRHHASHAITRTGSSPLTRGKLYTCSHPRQCTRLIPTHAGKTLVIGGGAGLPTAHPHSRGENSM